MNAEELPKPETTPEKISYALGTRIGGGLKRDGIEVDRKQLLAGIMDSYSGAALKLSDEEMNAVMTAFQQEMQAKAAAAATEAGGKNAEAGKDFLAKNGKKEGVVITESGLQYQVLTAGEGPKPTLSDKISAHYHGTLIDGTVFDSSVDRGQPASFPVSGVIPGWTEALQLMPQGSKWRLFVPSSLAYGERGAGSSIGPHSTLIFDVELLEIE
ncbi:MAG: FKBP-type peptidyl-prolyl cis-trans isomerase [Verrucomicrobiales bacterium]